MEEDSGGAFGHESSIEGGGTSCERLGFGRNLEQPRKAVPGSPFAAVRGRRLRGLRDARDMRAIPASFPTFQRITGNLSVMFLRPNRFEAMRGVIDHLAPGGQVVLTFPSLGTFDSIWRRIDQEMGRYGLVIERERLAAHVAERPSAAEARGWLERLELERIAVVEQPLEVVSGSGATVVCRGKCNTTFFGSS